MLKLIVIFLYIAILSVLASKARWMEEDFPKIYNATLPTLTLPGTHQSGAYWFSNTISPDAPAFVYRLARDYNISAHQFIQKWAINQNYKIYQQLMNGIRYFDIRVCENGDKEYVMCHSLFGAPIKEMLDDFKRFMNEHPKEVVVISFIVRSFVDNPYKVELMILEWLGSWLLPRESGIHTCIGKMVESNKRMVLFIQGRDYRPTKLWNSDQIIEDPWANTDSAQQLFSKQLEITMTRVDNPNRIFIPQWVTTVNEASMIASVLFQLNLPGQTTAIDGIERLLFHANALLNRFVQESSRRRSNVLFVDMYHHLNIVELARSLNDNCNDDRDWRQQRKCSTSPNFCSNPQNRQNCKRSCGLCPIPTGVAGSACTVHTECLSNVCKFGFCLQKSPHPSGSSCGANYNCLTGYCNPTLLKCQDRMIHDVCVVNDDCITKRCVNGKCIGQLSSKWFGEASLCRSHRDICYMNGLVPSQSPHTLSICGDSGSFCTVGNKVLCLNYLEPRYKRYAWLDGCFTGTSNECLGSKGHIMKTTCGNTSNRCPDGKFRILCGYN